MRSFLNNSELIEDAVVKLSDRLGITPVQVKRFFLRRSKKPTNVSTETYSNPLPGKD